MNSAYLIRISVNEGDFDKVTSILSVSPTSTKSFWELAIEEGSTKFETAFEYLLDLIEPNFDKLKRLGIEHSNITFWYLYGYVGQCNMEFSPHILSRLGKSDIALCISCWEETEEMDEIPGDIHSR